MATNPLTRRKFLIAGGITGGALALGTGLVMRGGGDAWYRSLVPAGVEPKALSLKSLGVLHAVCDTLIGPSSDGTPSAADARIAERIDRELMFHFPRMARDVEAALMLVEHAGVARFDFTRFTRLDAAAKEERLARMAVGSSLERQAFSGLRLMAFFYFYCDDRTWKAIHYEGPLLQVRKPPEADSNPFNPGAARG